MQSAQYLTETKQGASFQVVELYFRSFKEVIAMHEEISNSDRLVLKAFLACHIPAFIRETTIGELDLMEHYEELFNYTLCLLDHGQVDIRYNSLSSGEEFALSNGLRSYLSELIAKSENCELIIFACLSLCVIEIIKKHGINHAIKK